MCAEPKLCILGKIQKIKTLEIKGNTLQFSNSILRRNNVVARENVLSWQFDKHKQYTLCKFSLIHSNI